MKALIQTYKARKTADGWQHPKTGETLDASIDGDVFIMSADDNEGNCLLNFVLSRPVLEQMEDGMHKALTVEPVVVRLVEGTELEPSDKPRAFIHIGAGKCGSSLIQGLLNQPDVRDILPGSYEDLLCKTLQSHTPVMDFDDYYIRLIMRDIKEMIPKRDIVLSIENVFGAFTHAENCYDQSVRLLEYLFEEFDIKIFMYIRRQDTFLESMYNQDVKRYEKRTFDEYLADVRLDNLHWDLVADAYSKFDLTVRPFERKVLETGGCRDFIDALFRWMGQKVKMENIPVTNASLSEDALKIQQLANNLLSQDRAYHLSMHLERHLPKQPDEKHRLFEDNTPILKRFRESNKRVFDKHLPGFDPEYYLGA